MNERNEALKVIPARNLSDLKYVARASALLVGKKVDVKIDHIIHRKRSVISVLLEVENRGGYCNFQKGFK